MAALAGAEDNAVVSVLRSVLAFRKLLSALRRTLLGENPRALLALASPTLLALLLDVSIRSSALAGLSLQAALIYASSLLISAAFWAGPSSILAALIRRRSASASAASAALLVLWVLPFAACAFAGQAVYHRVFHSYVGRDTVRLGVALRGTVRDWFDVWGSPWLLLGMVLTGATISVGILAIARRAAASMGSPFPLLPMFAFAGAVVCFWTDQVDSRFLQAATPDDCFVHGAIHALRTWVEGNGKVRQGMSLRTPAPLPPLASSHRPNVLLVLTESVRADAMCSDPPPTCRAPFLDDVVPDRQPLGKLTSQTPNTFSACMLLWTGLSPKADFHEAHSAPVLWELARAVGYRTAYITSQNPNYEDFGMFTRRAGIDVLVTALDLGGLVQEQLGAPDERAVDEVLRFVRSTDARTPYFAVLHLSNTHAPYRVAEALAPFTPQSADPLGDIKAFHNRYRNSVTLQERTLSQLLRALRGSPRWQDTAVIFLSDHGEQFREHGGLYHNHSLFDEELRIPGWIAAGARALGDEQRAALASYAGHRTYMQDVHETVVDLFGLEGARASLALADEVRGRSLLRDRALGPGPTVLLATATSVWEPDDARFGATADERALIGPPGAMACFDTLRDPRERSPLPADACDDLRATVSPAFVREFVGEVR